MKRRLAVLRWLWLGLLWLALPLAGAHSGPTARLAVTPAPATLPRPHLYTGEQIDPDLGMYYLRARYYQPGIGRFWTLDSYEGERHEPLTLHKYAYCHANPLNGVDPSGNMTMAIDVGAMNSLIAGIQSFGSAAAVGVKTVAANKVVQIVAAAAVAAYATDTLFREGVRESIIKAKDIISQTGRSLSNLKVVPVSQTLMPDVALNVSTAQAAGQGMMLTRVSPAQAALNRQNATKGLGSAGTGMSWDEYPFASGRLPSGPNPRVAAVPWIQNCIQGGVIAAAYKLEKINVGDNYFVVVVP